MQQPWFGCLPVWYFSSCFTLTITSTSKALLWRTASTTFPMPMPTCIPSNTCHTWQNGSHWTIFWTLQLERLQENCDSVWRRNRADWSVEVCDYSSSFLFFEFKLHSSFKRWEPNLLPEIWKNWSVQYNSLLITFHQNPHYE